MSADKPDATTRVRRPSNDWRNQYSFVPIKGVRCKMCETMMPSEYFKVGAYRRDGTPTQRIGCEPCQRQILRTRHLLTVLGVYP